MIKKIIIALVILVVLFVIGAQLFLQYGLTDSMRKYVLPTIREKLQVDVSLERLSVNLLAGSFAVYSVNVAAPPGFPEPNIVSLKRFNIRIGIPALLKGGVTEIRKAVVKGGVVTIIRNADGRLNIEPLLGVIPEQTEAGQPASAAVPAPAAKPANVIVKDMEINSLVHYADYQLARSGASEQALEPFRMGFSLQAKLKNIANYGNADVLSGSINLLGTIMLLDKKCAFDVHGRIAPIVDPQRLSFDVSGSIQEVNLQAFEPLIRKHGIEGGFVSGTATLLCRKGVFDPDKSVLRLTFKQIRLTEEKRAKIPGGRLPESLKLIIPVQGTLDHPEIDFDDILKRTLLSPDMFESILKGVLQDQGKARDKGKSDTALKLQKATETPKKKILDLNKSLKNVFGK